MSDDRFVKLALDFLKGLDFESFKNNLIAAKLYSSSDITSDDKKTYNTEDGILGEIKDKLDNSKVKKVLATLGRKVEKVCKNVDRSKLSDNKVSELKEIAKDLNLSRKATTKADISEIISNALGVCGDGDDEPSHYSREELKEMNITSLKKIAKDLGITNLAKYKSANKVDLIKKILEKTGDIEEDKDEKDDSKLSDLEDKLSNLGITALKELAKQNDIKGYAKFRSQNKQELIDLLLKKIKGELLAKPRARTPPDADSSDRSQECKECARLKSQLNECNEKVTSQNRMIATLQDSIVAQQKINSELLDNLKTQKELAQKKDIIKDSPKPKNKEEQKIIENQLVNIENKQVDLKKEEKQLVVQQNQVQQIVQKAIEQVKDLSTELLYELEIMGVPEDELFDKDSVYLRSVKAAFEDDEKCKEDGSCNIGKACYAKTNRCIKEDVRLNNVETRIIGGKKYIGKKSLLDEIQSRVDRKSEEEKPQVQLPKGDVETVLEDITKTTVHADIPEETLKELHKKIMSCLNISA